jgi:hypothetical protein
MNFKQWILSESLQPRLAIFDFDETLANTPRRPENWVAKDYIAPDGKVKKSKDWWTHPDSLEGNWDFKDQVIQEFQKARQDPNTQAVLLTGRVGMRTAHIIRDRLRRVGLHGRRVISSHHHKAIQRQKEWPHGDEHPDDEHEEYYKGDMQKEPDFPKVEKGKPDSDTFNHKAYVIEKKLMHDGVRVIDFWDDREGHRQGFVELFQKLLREWPNLQQVTIHVVSPQGIMPISLTKDS